MRSVLFLNKPHGVIFDIGIRTTSGICSMTLSLRERLNFPYISCHMFCTTQSDFHFDGCNTSDERQGLLIQRKSVIIACSRLVKLDDVEKGILTLKKMHVRFVPALLSQQL
ncbi:hypothetical protein TNCV_4739161 [Trichonephila clavipes]|nr:hypothetical protein TNCV_4739161 [Trichonephila clavipes]